MVTSPTERLLDLGEVAYIALVRGFIAFDKFLKLTLFEQITELRADRAIKKTLDVKSAYVVASSVLCRRNTRLMSAFTLPLTASP